MLEKSETLVNKGYALIASAVVTAITADAYIPHSWQQTHAQRNILQDTTNQMN